MTDWYAVSGVIIGVATIIIALIIYFKQKRDGDKLQEVVDSIRFLTQGKAELEQSHKVAECKRIIGLLQRIHNDEEGLKGFLTTFKIGDPADENWKLVFVVSFQDNVNSSIVEMNDAMGQLQRTLNDTSLRQDFLKFIPWLHHIPTLILKHNFPQKEHPYMLEGLIVDINKQTANIQEFIRRFNEEMESSFPEKVKQDDSVAREVLDPREVIDHSKYFSPPPL